MLRGLIHHWRLNVAVALAAAVATAVLTGALMVGDSVRGSLRELTLQRLGRVDEALVRDRFFDASLVERFVTHPDVPGRVAVAAPAVLVRASVVHAESGARASGVQLQGVDERFDGLLDWPGRDGLDLERGTGQPFPSIVLNEKLAGEIGAGVGDGVLVSFERYSEVPRDTLLGEKDPADVLGRMRVTVKDIVPDEGGGRFGLVANQVTPFNAFVELGRLQRALELDRGVNTLLVARPGDDGAVDRADAERLDAVLAEVVSLGDMGLVARRRGDILSVESKEFVLRPRLAKTLLQVAAAEAMPARTVLSYLANRMTAGQRATPYSTVAAVEPLTGEPFLSLTAVRGSADRLAAGEILINTWAADDLAAGPGDELRLTYFEVGPREELLTRERDFRVRGVVAMDGLGADASLTPDYPGIADADDISAWDPPFPVDLDAVRPKDEEYWDTWRAVPKAFVQADEGRRLWGTRHGDTTAVRVAVGDDAGEARFREALRAALDPAAQGFRFQPVKADGLDASAGATNFGEYFSYFSFFIIVSAALLVGLLFRLGIEQRGREVGLLLAVGTPLRTVRRRLLAEGIVVAAMGGLLGALGGWGYAWLMMVGLRTVWVGAVGTPVLFLHVVPATLVAGLLGSLAIVVVSQWLAIGSLRRIPTPLLLAGSVRVPRKRRGGGLSRVLAPLMIAVAVALLGSAIAFDQVESVGLTVGAGFSLLVGGLAGFAWWCRRGSRGSLARGGAVLGMAARNSSWNPGRSILSVILVASACFLIVLVGAFRHEFGGERLGKESGTGGFALMAESTVPIHGNLDDAADRLDLGIADPQVFAAGVTIYPLRMLPGNDTSCLNLYEPDQPRVLGLGRDVIERGGFTFQAVLQEADNPWNLLTELDLGPGVIPAVADAASAQWIWKLGLGEDVIIENEFGEELHLRLVGLVQKSIFQSEILVFEDHFLDNFPTRGGYGAFLIDAPPPAEAAVAETLEGGLDRYGFDAVSTVRRLADFQAVENTYMSTFQMLGGLGLLLGTVGLGVVLLRNVIERRGELATLRAFGYRRRRIAWIVVAENGFLLLIGLAIGALSALGSVSPRLLAGTLHLPWTFLGATLAVIFLVGMVSCTAAVQGALRVPLLAVLKSDA